MEILDKYGEPIFNIKFDVLGAPVIKLSGSAADELDVDDFSRHLKAYFD